MVEEDNLQIVGNKEDIVYLGIVPVTKSIVDVQNDKALDSSLNFVNGILPDYKLLDLNWVDGEVVRF